MTPSSTWLAVLLGALASLAAAQDLVAELDYGTFRGAYSQEYNISYWRKIPFAAPPVGENRFRAPQPPHRVEGVYDSDQSFDMCPQRTVNGSEDCLYLGLYSRPWTRGQPLRPVVVVFYGGGFIQGSASFTIPPSAYPVLNTSAAADLVFIYPNYRVNAFGLLAGREIAEDPRSDANAGLLDQRAAIRWANLYARHFGGDPDDVSIWGQSAGGGSVVAQVIADQDHAPGTWGAGARFSKALASSPFWPKTYEAVGPESQALYDAVVESVGCAAERDTLACLKRADVQAIRNISLALSNSQTYTTSSYTWAPVIDGGFLPRRLAEATRVDGDGKKRTRRGSGGGGSGGGGGAGVNAQRAFGMYNALEGETFVPGGLHSATDAGTPPFNESEAGFEKWLAGFLPGLAPCEREAATRRYYPPAGTSDPVSGAYNTSYERAGFLFRDVVLACPAYYIAAAAREGGWVGEYDILPAKHASDVYWWNTVNPAQQEDPLHYEGYAGAFASFFAAGDPNRFKLTDASVPGVPPLSSGREFVIDADGFSTASVADLKARCEFWRKVSRHIPM
ncbi:hypothetical protein VTK73DRAFT_2263 [Phialemonium thermophilum]|uniref:Carboxylic ester hydrolase n=1 Tax=Phialemonium thermophilum TaxID=223376 RepID=A0ABR3VSE4_9PEZI